MAVAQCAADATEYGVEVIEDLVVGKAQDGPAGRVDEAIAHAVVAALGRSMVVGAIDFNDQRGFKAAEVDDDRTKDPLPAEFDAQVAITQGAPQLTLGCGGCATQGSSAIGHGPKQSWHDWVIGCSPPNVAYGS